MVKSDDEGMARRAAGGIEALELLPGVYLSWSPREKVERAVEAVKRAVVERWEESGEGPTLEVAVDRLWLKTQVGPRGAPAPASSSPLPTSWRRSAGGRRCI